MFGSRPSTSTPIVQLAEVSNEVRTIISDGMFYGTMGVLTSVATHHPDLDFATIYKGYANGWSTDEIHALGESLVMHAEKVIEQVTAQWVMEARHLTVVEDMRREDAVHPMVRVETGLEASVVLPPTEPNIVLTKSKLPLSSSTIPSADAGRGP